jgi:coatomer subunit beta
LNGKTKWQSTQIFRKSFLYYIEVIKHHRDVSEFLKHIIKSTNMNCLTPESALAGDCGFLSANLYARSVFGEDALANVSIEQQPDGKIGGFIRIRSKTQGIALSLGDKITMKQRVFATANTAKAN